MRPAEGHRRQDGLWGRGGPCEHARGLPVSEHRGGGAAEVLLLLI